MIDTVRAKIPLSSMTDIDLSKICTWNKRQFVDKKGNLQTFNYGTYIFPVTKAKLTIFYNPYKKEDLYFEGSFPKIWYGDNVHLLYEEQLEPVLQMIYEVFNRVSEGAFPHYYQWYVQRFDTTYAWKYQSEEKAIEVIDYVKKLELARNSTTIYPYSETVTFGSKKSRTITFYRKSPEFNKKGQKELIKNGLLNEALDCTCLAEGVVRFEIVNKVEHLRAYFKEKRAITFDMFLGKRVAADILNINLKKLKGDIDLKLVHDRAIYKSLRSKFDRFKSTRLFCFYKSFFSKLSTRNLIVKNANSGDISDDLKDLKEANVVIPTFLSNSQFDLSIPSPIAVNLPPSSEAIAAELEKRLNIIRETVEYVTFEHKPDYVLENLDEE